MGTFARRLIGASALSAATYEEVEADRSSMTQAVGVVLLSAVAAGIGARGYGVPLSFVPTMAVVALLAWTSWAFLTYRVGVRLIPTDETRSDLYEMMRTMGFAAAPGILRVFGVIPILTTPVFAATAVWMLLAMIVAVRQALDYRSTARAIAVCVLGWLIAIAIIMAFSLLNPPVLSAQTLRPAASTELRVDVQRGTSTMSASAVLVQSKVVDGETIDYFMTSGRLFRAEDGTALAAPTAVNVMTATGSRRARPEDVSLPSGTSHNVAIVAVRSGAMRTGSLPPLQLPTDTLSAFGYEWLQRTVSGPLLTVSCGEVRSGTVDVPFKVDPGHLVVDAHASLLNQTALRLGEVTVMTLGDRKVALRFTLTGQEPPRFRPPTPCPQGQALLSVKLDIVSTRTP